MGQKHDTISCSQVTLKDRLPLTGSPDNKAPQPYGLATLGTNATISPRLPANVHPHFGFCWQTGIKINGFTVKSKEH